MNALQHNPPASRSVQPRRKRRQRVKAVRRNRAAYRGTALENMAVLGINTILISIGLYALAQLVPYQLSQQAKLQTLQQEATQTKGRLNKLKAKYEGSLAPARARKIAEDNGHLVGDKTLTINWHKQR